MQSWYTDPAVSDVCAQFNKTFIFKARLCLLLIFSSSVLGCSLWDVQQHSSYYSICASKPAQNNKNVQVCLFAALVWVKLNRYMAVLSVVQFRSSSGIKKNHGNYFSGTVCWGWMYCPTRQIKITAVSIYLYHFWAAGGWECLKYNHLNLH